MAPKKGKNVVARTVLVKSQAGELTLEDRVRHLEMMEIKADRVGEIRGVLDETMDRFGKVNHTLNNDVMSLSKTILALGERVVRLEASEREAKETQRVFESRLDRVESMEDRFKDETRRFHKQLEMVRGSDACEAEVKALRIEVDELKEELLKYKGVMSEWSVLKPFLEELRPKVRLAGDPKSVGKKKASEKLKCYFCDGPHMIRGCTEKSRLAAIVKAIDESSEGGVAGLGVRAAVRAVESSGRRGATMSAKVVKPGRSQGKIAKEKAVKPKAESLKCYRRQGLHKVRECPSRVKPSKEVDKPERRKAAKLGSLRECSAKVSDQAQNRLSMSGKAEKG
ncbi:hypothetical protein V6N13_080130 [Hibiscus sabdariffa]